MYESPVTLHKTSTELSVWHELWIGKINIYFFKGGIQMKLDKYEILYLFNSNDESMWGGTLQ